MPDPSVFRDATLCVVGNINRDLKTTPLPAGDYLFQDGETSVAGIYETIGGGGANSAAIAARLGAQVSFVGQVGDDEIGRRLEAAMERSGVRCHLRKREGLSTGTTLNLVFGSGQRHFLSCHPNNVALGFDDLDLSALRNVRHLLRADLWFSESMLQGGNEKLFCAAREAGVKISIDLNWDPQWGRASLAEIQRRKKAIRAVLPQVELVHGNTRELAEFTDDKDLSEAVAKLREWGARAGVIHLGERGAGYFAGSDFVTEPPARVVQARQATGTGDVLSVCMILLHHRTDFSVQEKLRLANQVVAEFMEGRRNLIPSL